MRLLPRGWKPGSSSVAEGKGGLVAYLTRAMLGRKQQVPLFWVFSPSPEILSLSLSWKSVVICQSEVATATHSWEKNWDWSHFILFIYLLAYLFLRHSVRSPDCPWIQYGDQAGLELIGTCLPLCWGGWGREEGGRFWNVSGLCLVLPAKSLGFIALRSVWSYVLLLYQPPVYLSCCPPLPFSSLGTDDFL